MKKNSKEQLLQDIEDQPEQHTRFSELIESHQEPQRPRKAFLQQG